MESPQRMASLRMDPESTIFLPGTESLAVNDGLMLWVTMTASWFLSRKALVCTRGALTL